MLSRNALAKLIKDDHRAEKMWRRRGQCIKKEAHAQKQVACAAEDEFLCAVEYAHCTSTEEEAHAQQKKRS